MTKLERSLSFPVMLIIGINSIMGTGVFFLHAIAAGEAGPMSLISWLIMGFLAMGVGAVFAELSGMFPTAGGVYDYAKKAFSPFASFMTGWVTMVVGNVTIAMLVVGAIRYLNPDLPLTFSIGASIAFIALFNYMAYRGLQTSAVMLTTFGIITLCTVAALIIPGLFAFRPENLAPFFTHRFSNVLIGVFLVAETFFGWETVTFLAEETKDARTVIPKVLLISTALIAVLVFVFALVALGVIPWQEFAASPAPLADLAGALYGGSAAAVFSILVYTSIIGSVAGWIVSAPRLLMALAKDKMFIEQLAQIHPVHKTPYKAILFQTVLTSVLVVVGSGSYELLLHLLVPLVFVMYGTVVVSLLVLRRKARDVERTYTLPGGDWLPGSLIAALLALLLFWAFTDPTAPSTLALAGSFVLAGWPVYLLLKFTYDPEAVATNAHVSGRLMVWLENVLLPRSVREHLLSLIEVAEKRVLEFGANVGTFTMHLAEEVGPHGMVISTELSSSNADIVRERARKGGHDHVSVIHDEHHLNRIHPDVSQIDVFVSIGYLSYIQDLRKILRELRERLPENGKVLLVEYIDYFGFIPNAGWTSDVSRLERVFAEEGFAVTITKKKGWFWNYLIVHGIRSDEDVPFI